MHFLLIPGFALHPLDYCNIVSNFDCTEHTIEVIDIWPYSIEEIKKIGYPGTESFNCWILEKSELITSKLNDEVIIVAHSAGAVVAREMKCRFIGIGCKYSKDIVLLIIGKNDKLANDNIERDCKREISGGHFNCVTQKAMNHVLKLQKELSGDESYPESYLDSSKEIVNIILEFIKQN